MAFSMLFTNPFSLFTNMSLGSSPGFSSSTGKYRRKAPSNSPSRFPSFNSSPATFRATPLTKTLSIHFFARQLVIMRPFAKCHYFAKRQLVNDMATTRPWLAAKPSKSPAACGRGDNIPASLALLHANCFRFLGQNNKAMHKYTYC
jgi:hypothetical protein